MSNDNLKKKIQAVRCAHADLIGALQAKEQNDIHAHDWSSHELSIEELEEAFPFLSIFDSYTPTQANIADVIQDAHALTTEILKGFLQDFNMLGNDEYDGPCESWFESAQKVQELATILEVDLS